MADPKPPEVFFRLGSHAEKEYLQKTSQFWDGLIVGANLVEVTPGATASLIVGAAGHARQTEYVIDPMTYAFGSYVDPEIGRTRSDLDWIKSDRKVKGQTQRSIKKSYAKLATIFGEPFEGAATRSAALRPSDFADDNIARAVCRRVLDYQRTRIGDEFSADPDFVSFAAEVPRPAFLFSPYFYAEPSQWSNWLDTILRLARISGEESEDLPVHMILCLDASALRDGQILTRCGHEIPDTGVKGVWFWFSGLFEDRADATTLGNFRDLILKLSSRVRVYNLHGGFLSLALSKFGLAGVSHGLGYGEQKDVVPVIGQSTPTVRYYLPPVRSRSGVASVERAFRSVGINAPEDFHKKICSCAVCKGVLSKGLAAFQEFGDTRLSTPQSKRVSQTPAAAKRCRFHFILNRVKERDWVRSASLDEIVGALIDAQQLWSPQPSLTKECQHLGTWRTVLSPR